MKFLTFYNISNHPSEKWGDSQKQAALDCLGMLKDSDESNYAKRIVDINFPNIDPNMDGREVNTMAKEFIDNILKDNIGKCIFHVMGEMTFTYNAVNHAISKGIPCCASTTERIVSENSDETKTVTFGFVRFRPY